eukprot:1392286-Pleurochrysis_carterae.AAC.1
MGKYLLDSAAIVVKTILREERCGAVCLSDRERSVRLWCRARTHSRTHSLTHARTHARTHPSM